MLSEFPHIFSSEGSMGLHSFPLSSALGLHPWGAPGTPHHPRCSLILNVLLDNNDDGQNQPGVSLSLINVIVSVPYYIYTRHLTNALTSHLQSSLKPPRSAPPQGSEVTEDDVEELHGRFYSAVEVSVCLSSRRVSCRRVSSRRVSRRWVSRRRVSRRQEHGMEK